MSSSAAVMNEGVTLRESEGDIDLRALGQAIWRKRWLIILPTILMAIASYYVTSGMTPLYRSEARILVDSRENPFLRPGAIGAERQVELADEQAVRSQVQLILSRDLARAVVADQRLDESTEFDVYATGVSLPRRILSFLGLSSNPMRMGAQERVLTAYYERLTVYPVNDSRVIAIEFSSEDPERAKNVANAIARIFLDTQQSVKQSSTRQASTWLSNEIDQLRTRVAEAEARVEDFRAEAGLFTGSNNTTISTQQLSELNTQLATARAAQAETQARARLIRELIDAGRPVELSDVTSSELVRRLSEQLITLRGVIASESRTLLPGHPRMRELEGQRIALEGQLAQEAARVARALENDAQISGARVESLLAGIEAQKGVATLSNEKEVQLRALEREARAQRELLEQFLTRFREASARETMDALPPDARIISTADASNTPYFPRVLPTVTIASGLTFAFMLMMVAAGELLAPSSAAYQPRPVSARERQMRSRETIPTAAPAVPVHGQTRSPRRASGRRDGRASDIEAADATIIEDLAAQLAAGPRGDTALRLLVMAALDEDDSGTLALALARRLDAAGRKVIVVDLFGSAAVASSVERPLAAGLKELIAGDASFAETIQRDRGSGVHVIVHGRGEVAANAQRTGVVLSALALTYDFVLVLSRPDSAKAIAPRLLSCNAAILVAGSDAHDARTIAMHDALMEEGLDDIVVLLNTGDEPKPSDKPGQATRPS